MIGTTIQTPFDLELTGILVEEETKTITPNQPSRSSSTWVTIFNDLARIVDLSNQTVKVDNYDKQKAEKYCIYFDRAFVGIITEGMRVKFRNDALGDNELFVDNNSKNIITGYITREVKPQSGSRIGKLECYITSNN